MANILVLAPYCSLPDEPYFNRFLFLAKLFEKNGHKVTLVSSKFRHFDKTVRRIKKPSSLNIEIVLLEENGYKKNISFRRIFSHRVFCKNFEEWLSSQNTKKFDLVYSALPLIKTNQILVKYQYLLNYKLIIDIQDLWPEAFKMIIPGLRFLPDHFLPKYSLVSKLIKNCDAIVAVSKTFVKRALLCDPQALTETVYIGADFELLEAISPQIYEDSVMRYFYIGSLEKSYDLETPIRGINKLNDLGYPSELHIFGTGSKLQQLQKISNLQIRFHGALEYKELISKVKNLDIAINPIIDNSSASITNKLSDYISLKKKILNSQTNLEVLDLIDKTCGENYLNYDADSFVNAALILMKKEMSDFNAEELFNRNKSYNKIIDLIDRVLND